MAPKKDRIKVKQEPQGETCLHQATPPSKPGVIPVTGRQGQKPKKLRLSLPRAAAPLQFKKAQIVTKLYIPFAPFVRLVREITESCSREVTCWTPEALLNLQDAADLYLKEPFVAVPQLTMPASSTARDGGEQLALGLPEEAEEKPKQVLRKKRV